MNEKKRNLILCVFLALLSLTLITSSLTYARYTTERRADGAAGGDIEYVVANWFEVRNEEELIAAVQNGNVSIKIADDADEPFTVSTDLEDLGVISDLTIDLNGKTLIRNSRAPMFDVTSGITLTVTDSASAGGGAFYNPVGSTLAVSGGTMTVGGGNFESGPRAAEYFAAGSALIDGTQSVTVSTRDRYTQNSYEQQDSEVTMPVFAEGAYGVYFEENYQNDYIQADTYLLYTVADKEEEVTATDVFNADFYYTYSLSEEENAVVFGYKDVKNFSETAGGSLYPFASVEAEGGNIFVRGGTYHSYFGTEASYGIRATGGQMAVNEGEDIAFTAAGEGTCVYCDFEEDGSLAISTGTFTSVAGNTVSVTGGVLTLDGGSFVKNDGDNAAIYVQEGSIGKTEQNATVDITVNGSYSRGIYLLGTVGGDESIILGDVDIRFSADGTQNTGIQVDNGDLTAGALTIDGGNGAAMQGTAIYVNGGSVTLNGEATLVTQSPTDENGQFPTGASGQFLDGVHVSGGSLKAATLNVTHTGVENDDQRSEYSPETLFYQFVTKSFAVRVTGAAENETQSNTVSIDAGTIKNSIGGGLYVGGGEVTLGNGNEKEDQATGPTITTSGKEGQYVYDDEFVSYMTKVTNWKYKQSKTGGPAVEVNGGTLTIHQGIYQATEQGDGIVVKNGEATINDGTFTGKDSYKSGNNNELVAGPAASYAFKLYGGTATINGGSIGKSSAGSGAFLMGTSLNSKAEANIHGGSFTVTGQAGISVYQYVDVLFDPKEGGITVTGDAAGMAIEYNLPSDSNSTVKICNSTSSTNTVTFTGTRKEEDDGSSGIWYAGTCTNDDNEVVSVLTSLTIEYGTFKGESAGLLFYNRIYDKVSITGGTFKGKTSAFGGDNNVLDDIKTTDIFVTHTGTGNETVGWLYDENDAPIRDTTWHIQAPWGHTCSWHIGGAENGRCYGDGPGDSWTLGGGDNFTDPNEQESLTEKKIIIVKSGLPENDKPGNCNNKGYGET